MSHPHRGSCDDTRADNRPRYQLNSAVFYWNLSTLNPCRVVLTNLNNSIVVGS
jgi:hypothetical protein